MAVHAVSRTQEAQCAVPAGDPMSSNNRSTTTSRPNKQPFSKQIPAVLPRPLAFQPCFMLLMHGAEGCVPDHNSVLALCEVTGLVAIGLCLKGLSIG